MGYVPMPLVEMPTQPKNGPIAGDMYFDMDTGTIKIWTGHEWRHLESKPAEGWVKGMQPKRVYDRWDLEE
jgi:hypothetical protein